MKDFYVCSEAVVKAFPELVKSNPFKSGYDYDKDKNYYIVIVPDFEPIESYYNTLNPSDFWIYEIVDSQIILGESQSGEDEDVDEFFEDPISVDECKKMGLFSAIQYYVGVTKEQNIAYAIFKICERDGLDPIEFANKL